MIINQTSNGNYARVNTKPRTQSFLPAQEKNNTSDKIDSNEKRFFAKIFPDSQEDIMNYHFYEKSGKMNGIKIGSNYDRRG